MVEAGNDLNPVGSGNLGDALDHIAGAGFDDDFLTGDDVTIAQIHSLASSKPSGSISTPPPLMVPEPINDFLPTPSPRTLPEEPKETLLEPALLNVAALPSPGRTTSNTSSIDAGPIVSPLPKVSPRSNLSSPGRKPAKSASMDRQASSSTATATSDGTAGTPKPRRPSGGLPRVAMLASNKPAVPKREETTQRKTTPPPFRSGGTTVRTPSSTSGVGASATSTRGRVSTPTGASMSRRVSGTSPSSSPVIGAAATGGLSRSSSRSSTASGGGAGSSMSRLAPSNSTSRPAWGSTSGASARSLSARSTTSGGPPSRRTPPPAATGTTPPTRRTVSTSSAASSSAGRGRVVARSSSPSKIPSGPGASRTASTRPRPGAAAVVVGTTATAEPTEDDTLDTLVGLMGEIKDIKHELNMNTPTAADGAENPEFGSAQIEAEESLPGPQFIASVDTGVETAAEEGEDGVIVDSLEKKGSVGEEESQAAGEGAKGENGAAEENVPEASATVVEDDEEEEKPAPPVVVEDERPAFTAAEVEQENKVPAKALCSCSIM